MSVVAAADMLRGLLSALEDTLKGGNGKEVDKGRLALACAGVLSALCGVQLYLQNRRRHPNEAPILRSYIPFLGSALDFSRNPSAFVREACKKLNNAPVFTFYMVGKRLTVITGQPNHETFFMTRNAVFSPREVYKVMKPVFGPGVVYDAPSYERMREQLNFVAAELNIKNFKKFAPLIRDETLERLRLKWGGTGKLNLLIELSQLTVQTASRCLLGPHVRDEISPELFAKHLHDLEEGLSPLGVFYPWLPSPGIQVTLKARHEIARVLRAVVARRRSNPNADNTDVLGCLLNGVYQNGDRVPDEEAVGILIATMFAGQHTSLIASSWTCMMLAHHPQIVAKLREELREIRGTDDPHTPLEYDHISKAALLEACVKESLRIHPPLVLLMRMVLQDCKVGGHMVRPGDIICVSPAGSMRDETIYPNPEVWDPMRFLPPKDDEINSKPYAFVGFGAGSHRCLGEKFGLLQVKTIVATLFENYEITPIMRKIPDPNYQSLVVGPYEHMCEVNFVKRH